MAPQRHAIPKDEAVDADLTDGQRAVFCLTKTAHAIRRQRASTVPWRNMFDLKRPCKDCPFRKGQGERYHLSEQRLQDIVNSAAFQCHKTIEFDDECQIDEENWDETWRPIKNDARAQQCAGLMAVRHQDKRPNQIMQVAQRLDVLDPNALDPGGEAYGSWDDVLEAHGKGRGLCIRQSKGSAR